MSDVPPASGPGRLSQRTDLGPSGNQGQPTRLPTGQPYGQRKALRGQQQAAPMEADGPVPAGLQGAFGPTRRPSEAPTAGGALGPGSGPSERPKPVREDPDLFLRALLRKYKHPDIARILMKRVR